MHQAPHRLIKACNWLNAFIADVKAIGANSDWVRRAQQIENVPVCG
jgi:hypothetical protein